MIYPLLLLHVNRVVCFYDQLLFFYCTNVMCITFTNFKHLNVSMLYILYTKRRINLICAFNQQQYFRCFYIAQNYDLSWAPFERFPSLPIQYLHTPLCISLTELCHILQYISSSYREFNASKFRIQIDIFILRPSAFSIFSVDMLWVHRAKPQYLYVCM